MQCQLVGVDCATDDRKIGLAFGLFENDHLTITEAALCDRGSRACTTVVRRLLGREARTLIAIDAPLGWPRPMSRALADHIAGDEIAVAANEMFRRTTDRHIYTTLGKTSLDVGADRIARTAHAALRFLGELRRELHLPIPLAWSSTFSDTVAAIEVYPAATLLGHGIRASGYKQNGQDRERREIVERLSGLAKLPADTASMERNADVLDAAMCLVAAADFLAGRAVAPTDADVAASEGWIWTRGRGSET